MSHIERTCFERELSPAEGENAQILAVERGLSMPLSPLEAVTLNATLWAPGAQLHVCFLEGDPQVHRKVREWALVWTRYANIDFIFDDRPDAEIRVSFRNSGSWSYLGNQALGIPQDEPTMNYGWLEADSDDDTYSSVVLHEFGHALGMIHEHLSPAAGIQWDKEAVYQSLSGPPNNWNRAKVDANMFQRYDGARTQFTAFDPDSIMLYAFPATWTTNGVSTHENSHLSKEDISFIRSRYPGRS